MAIVQNPRPLTNLQEAEKGLTAVLQEIERLPTAGVDPEAVQCALGLSQFHRTVISEIRRKNSSDFPFVFLARGLQGDFFGAVADEGRINNGIKQQYAQIQQQLATTRAMISARYGTEFPPINY